MLERDYQAKLIKKIERLLGDCLVLKNDSDYRQGIPDLTIFCGDRWAMLEVKTSAKAPYQPNQEYYLEKTNEYSFSATIYPANEREVLRDLQRALQPDRAARLP